MKKFKSFLLEYLTDEQREHYGQTKMTDHARQTTDHFFGKGNDIVRGSLDHMTDKSEIHKKIENHIGKELSHEEYRSGMTKDKYGRDARVGRMIKDQALRDEFARDPVREHARGQKTQYTTSTVRGTEVAGQTNPEPNEQHPKGHSWPTSCKNLKDGINKHYVYDEIKHGTVVHFVHDHNGQEIYRATLQPHHSSTGDVAYSVDSEYGIKHPSFTADAHRVARELSGPVTKSVIYRKHPKVYDDNAEEFMLHPNATKEHLDHAINSPAWNERKLAAKHPNISHSQLSKLMNDEDADVRHKATQNPNMTADLLHKALKDPKIIVTSAALSHPNINSEHVGVALKSRDIVLRSHAASHEMIEPDQITTALKDPSSMVREMAIENPKATREHIDTALNDHVDSVRASAIKHPLATSEHLHKALDDESTEVKTNALRHPNIKPEHLMKAVDDKDFLVAIIATMHKDATPDVLRKAYEHKHWSVKSQAVMHKNTPRDVLEKAANSEYDKGIARTARERIGIS